jgi:hypothetical protein
VWLGIAEARVLAAGGLLMGLLDLWYHIEVEIVGGFLRLVVRGTEGMRFEYVAGWIGVVLVVQLLEQRLLPLFLLVKDLDGVLELRESCSFTINMLSSGFGTLSYCLSSFDSFLFLMKPLDLLLNSGQLFLFYSFVLGVFILDLLELCIFLDDWNWRRCLRMRLFQGASVGLG